MMPTIRAGLAMVAATMALGVVTAAQADTRVFRCVEPHGRTLYTDVPCRNAAVVDLQPGRADPDAAKRLADAQAALDAGMERRRAEEARDAARREAFYPPPAPAPPPDPLQTVDAYWPLYGGYFGPVNPRPLHVQPIRESRPSKEPRHVGRVPAPQPRR